MLFFTLEHVITLHELLVFETGGAHGMRNRGALESALAQPRMTFSGAGLYPTLEEKAAAPGFSLISNHPFVDGNKRIGLAATVALLRANGRDLSGSVDEMERVVLAIAAGEMDREDWTVWVHEHTSKGVSYKSLQQNDMGVVGA